MLFQRYTLLNKDNTLKYILDCYDKEPNKKNINYMVSFEDRSWCFIEGIPDVKWMTISVEDNKNLRFPKN